MKIEDLTLSEIVTSKPAAAVLFENYNLDFCCGGKRKLSEVLKNEPTKLKEVISQIEKLFESKSEPETDFDRFSLSRLVDYIVETHHSYVKENLPVIQQHLEKVALKHGEFHPEMRKINTLFAEIKNDFEQHMMKEEMILFPQIKKMELFPLDGTKSTNFSDMQQPIHVMENEHEAAHKLIDEIKQLSNNFTPPADACTTFKLCLDELKFFESDLHRHVHLENNLLFPKAMVMQQKQRKINYN